MNKILLLPLCAALVLLPTLSFAAPAGSSYTNDEGAKVTQTGDVREVVIIDGDSIDGEVLKAGGVDVPGARHDKHKSMITLRGDFMSQLTALSNDI